MAFGKFSAVTRAGGCCCPWRGLGTCEGARAVGSQSCSLAHRVGTAEQSRLGWALGRSWQLTAAPLGMLSATSRGWQGHGARPAVTKVPWQSWGCDRWPNPWVKCSAELGGIHFWTASSLHYLLSLCRHSAVPCASSGGDKWLFLCPAVSPWAVGAGSSAGGGSGLELGPLLGIPRGADGWDALQTRGSIIPPECGGLNLHQPRCLGCVESVSHRNVSLVKPHLFSLPSGLLLSGGAKLCLHCQVSLIFRNECGQCCCLTYSLNGKKIEFLSWCR